MKLKQKIRVMIDALKFYMQLKDESKARGRGVDKHYRLDTSPSQEHQTEPKRTDKYKVHDFIEQKKNRTPFYKDDNKKIWE